MFKHTAYKKLFFIKIIHFIIRMKMFFAIKRRITLTIIFNVAFTHQSQVAFCQLQLLFKRHEKYSTASTFVDI